MSGKGFHWGTILYADLDTETGNVVVDLSCGHFYEMTKPWWFGKRVACHQEHEPDPYAIPLGPYDKGTYVTERWGEKRRGEVRGAWGDSDGNITMLRVLWDDGTRSNVAIGMVRPDEQPISKVDTRLQ